MSTTERKQGLSRERILEAAARVVGDEGGAALSMRRLAVELDVWPMAIYRYFRDKEELLDALAAHAADSIAVAPSRGSWQAQMHVLLDGAHRAIRADPEGLGARMPQAFLSQGWLRIAETGVSLLREAGLEAPEAAAAWRALWSYTYGSAILRVADAPAESLRLARSAVAALPDEEFPSLLESGSAFPESLADPDAFAAGLDQLLAGITASGRPPG